MGLLAAFGTGLFGEELSEWARSRNGYPGGPDSSYDCQEGTVEKIIVGGESVDEFGDLPFSLPLYRDDVKLVVNGRTMKLREGDKMPAGGLRVGGRITCQYVTGP